MSSRSSVFARNACEAGRGGECSQALLRSGRLCNRWRATQREKSSLVADHCHDRKHKAQFSACQELGRSSNYFHRLFETSIVFFATLPSSFNRTPFCTAQTATVHQSHLYTTHSAPNSRPLSFLRSGHKPHRKKAHTPEHGARHRQRAMRDTVNAR